MYYKIPYDIKFYIYPIFIKNILIIIPKDFYS